MNKSGPAPTTNRGRSAGARELRAWLSANEYASWESAAAELGLRLGDYVRNLTPSSPAISAHLRPLNVYAAGKIAPNDWRNIDRFAIDRDTWLECVSGAHAPMRTLPNIGRRVYYTGPFFVSCDHGCNHGPHSHGAVADGCAPTGIAPADVVRASYAGIERADVVYVRLDGDGAYGTAAEVGYAVALGKPIVLDVHPDLPVAVRNDLWFLIESAQRKRPDTITELAVRRVFSLDRKAMWDHTLHEDAANDT